MSLNSAHTRSMKKRNTLLLTISIFTSVFAVCLAFVFANFFFNANAQNECLAVQNREIISEFSAKLSKDGKQQQVRLTGVHASQDTPYFEDIKIEVNGTSFSPKENGGYSPSLKAFDFLGDGYTQLYYSASTGGSGGFGIYYVYDLSSDVTTLFDYSEYENKFSGKYIDGLAQINLDNKPVLYFPATGRVGAPEISGINNVEPSYAYLLDRYRLTLWQKVTGDYQADVLGYIVTLLDLKDNTTLPFSAN